MPASTLADLILHPIGEFLLQVVAYYVGRVVVSVVSLGRLKCDRFTADAPRQGLRWSGLFHRRGQQLELAVPSPLGGKASQG
jgi:hypothetical protein